MADILFAGSGHAWADLPLVRFTTIENKMAGNAHTTLARCYSRGLVKLMTLSSDSKGVEKTTDSSGSGLLLLYMIRISRIVERKVHQ